MIRRLGSGLRREVTRPVACTPHVGRTAFIDADKTGYDAYYERCLELLRPGGLVLVDNVLWSGKVADEDDRSEDTVALRAFNARLRDDSRIELCMLPVGDGLTIARKLV